MKGEKRGARALDQLLIGGNEGSEGKILGWAEVDFDLTPSGRARPHRRP